jgi:hypothetical protein
LVMAAGSDFNFWWGVWEVRTTVVEGDTEKGDSTCPFIRLLQWRMKTKVHRCGGVQLVGPGYFWAGNQGRHLARDTGPTQPAIFWLGCQAGCLCSVAFGMTTPS